MRASTYDPVLSRRKRLLSASSVGHKSPALTHVRIRDLDQDAYQMDLVVREVNKRLHDDSTFFSESRMQALPSYIHAEITLGPTELGRGEFGIVYQVDGLHPVSCECPKCLLKSMYEAAPEDHHKLKAKELDGVVVTTDDTMTPTVESTIRTTSHGTSKASSSSTDHQHHHGNALTTKSSATKDDEYKYDDRNIIKWTDGVEKSIDEMFSEEFQREEAQQQHNHDDDDDSVITETHDDDISELSTGSLIRPSGSGTPKNDTMQTRSLRENFDQYRKCYMQRNCIRQGRPRYAVKQLRPDLADDGETKYNAAIDLAVEAKFLAALKHPNIVRVRGTVGKPGHEKFMIMMDCLNLTLREKIVEWAYDVKIRRNATHNVFKRLFHIGAHYNQPDDSSKVDPATVDLHTDRLMAAYDLVRGMKFLHSNRVLYRDLKPENIAFDVRGRLKIFDFGLAKELKPKDLEEPPDSYLATGLTGSRRYMAPEVVLCKNYGFAADVYSYSIVIWELFSGKMAYEDMDFNSHFEDVVLKEKRPSIKLHGIPKTLIKLMQMAWDPDPLRRVDFKYIRQILKHESKLLNRDHIQNGHQHHLSNRTDYLMRQSARSQTNEMPLVQEDSEQTQPTGNR